MPDDVTTATPDDTEALADVIRGYIGARNNSGVAEELLIAGLARSLTPAVARIVAEKVTAAQADMADIEREAFGRGVAWATGDDHDCDALRARIEAVITEISEHSVYFEDRSMAQHARPLRDIEGLLRAALTSRAPS